MVKTDPPDPMRLFPHAKLNLCLKVTGRRQDGYHELVSLMVPVDLCDRIDLSPRPAGISLTCRGIDTPEDGRNLVYRAAGAFFDRSGIDGGVSIDLLKKIPVAAGLGGGSSDAACTLKALNRMWGEPLSRIELLELAVRLGADVPFFLHSGPQLARGIGEILEPMPNWPRRWYVIVTPPIQVSTAWVYSSLKIPLTSEESEDILKSLKKEPFRMADILQNDLESVTAERYPIIDSIKNLIREAGAEGALMSGSGPSVFGVFESEKQALSAGEIVSSRNLGAVFVVAQWEDIHSLGPGFVCS
jgi:4-diphosphocytidyl-2-C-methyl-D-erythritol kinase